MHISCDKDIFLWLEKSDSSSKVGSILLYLFLDLTNCQDIFLFFSIPPAGICYMFVIKESRKVASIFSIWIFKLTNLCWGKWSFCFWELGRNKIQTLHLIAEVWDSIHHICPQEESSPTWQFARRLINCKETNKLHGNAAPGRNGRVGAHLPCLSLCCSC